MDQKTLDKVTAIAAQVAQEMGFQLYSVKQYHENTTLFLEVCVDKDYSITLDQIEAYSDNLGTRLDQVEELSEPYTLDVASPGAERDFPKEDLPKLIGRYMSIEADNLKKGEKSCEGTLISIENDTILLRRFIKGRKKEYQIPLTDVKKCRLLVKI